MKLRKFLAAATFATGLAAASAAPVAAAEPTPAKPTFGFSSLKAMSPEAAKAKCAAYLKSVNKFDQAAFDKVWADPARPLLDQVADALALGNPAAAAMLADVRNPETPAPTEVPAYLKDAKQNPFMRANLALAFAKAASKKVAIKVIPETGTDRKAVKVVESPAFEEALEALNAVSPEQVVDPASYYFFKAVAEHGTMKRDAAVASIVRLQDVINAPHRYSQVSLLMIEDMFQWSPDPKDLANIGRLMDNSGRRLDLTRPGEKTQDIQKKIVFRLDEVIKEQENKQKQQQQANGGACPNGGKPGNQPGPGSLTPNQNAPDSFIMGGAGKGEAIEAKLRAYREKWGLLPPEKRAQIIEEMQREVPAQYKPMIDSYFKSLNKLNGFGR